MRYVLFNWLSPEDIADWETWTPEQQRADAQRHGDWFAKHRDHVVGGEELDEPRTVKTLRRGRQTEGIVILEAASIEEAVEIASDWPSLASQPNATVQVQPAFVRD
jgi:hypothetical protein